MGPSSVEIQQDVRMDAIKRQHCDGCFTRGDGCLTSGSRGCAGVVSDGDGMTASVVSAWLAILANVSQFLAVWVGLRNPSQP